MLIDSFVHFFSCFFSSILNSNDNNNYFNSISFLVILAAKNYNYYDFGTYFFKCKLLIGRMTFRRSSRCFFISLSRCFWYLAFGSILNDISVLPIRLLVAASVLADFRIRSPKLVLKIKIE